MIKLFTINKEFIFQGQREDLKEILKNSKDLKYTYRNHLENEIEFRPTISWGTMNVNGIALGIRVKAFVSDLDSDRLKITIKTNIRPEHYFLIVLFIFFFIGVLLSEESKWMILFLFGLWIICHLWFQFIYRLQENYLVDKVVQKLRLSENTK